MQGIVLAGGQGWRLKPDIWIPKPMLRINRAETLIDRQIRWLWQNKFSRVIIATNTKHMHQWNYLNMKIFYSVEKTKLGTGGAIKQALSKVTEKYVYILNVDDLIFGTTYNPKSLIDKARDAEGGAILLGLARSPFGIVETKKDYIVGFVQKPVFPDPVNIGHYAFKVNVIKRLFDNTGDFENEVLTILAQSEMLKYVELPKECHWMTVNTHKDYIRVLQYLNPEMGLDEVETLAKG